jgi:fatty-acyl-CoA synthase
MFSVAHWLPDTSQPVMDSTTGGVLSAAAATSPDKAALIYPAAAGSPATWTYAELYTQARACAASLLGKFPPGSSIAIWAANCPEWVIVEFAAGLAGLKLVTVNPAFGPHEARHVLADSGAVGLIYAERYRGNDIGAFVEQLRPSLPALRDTLPISRLGELLGDGATLLPDVDPGEPALVLYTSGTTGAPKGVVLSHRGITNNARLCAHRAEFGGGVWLNPMPLFHVGGCVSAVLGPVWTCGTQVLLEAFEPGLALRLMEQTKADVMSSVPAMALALLQHPEFEPERISCLRTILSGGSPVPEDLCRKIESALGCRFSIVYGQTELSSVVCQIRPDDSEHDKATSIGQPLPQVECRIADPVTGRTSAIGEVGELCARGYQSMLGYVGHLGSTPPVDDAGWIHTGDLASMDERGYFSVRGRLRELIIRGGENVWPREIEDVLRTHPAVADVAVVGIPDERLGEVIASVLCPAPGTTPVAEELRALCRAQLAAYKTPVRWFVLDKLPLTAAGKVRKFVIRDDIAAGKLTELG